MRDSNPFYFVWHRRRRRHAYSTRLFGEAKRISVAVEHDNNNKVFYYESIWLAIITLKEEL